MNLKLIKLSKEYKVQLCEMLAGKIADILIDQTVMEQVSSLYEPDTETLERAENIVSMMNKYRHRIKFDAGLTGEVKYKYDKAWRGYRLQWAANTSLAPGHKHYSKRQVEFYALPAFYDCKLIDPFVF